MRKKYFMNTMINKNLKKGNPKKEISANMNTYNKYIHSSIIKNIESDILKISINQKLPNNLSEVKKNQNKDVELEITKMFMLFLSDYLKGLNDSFKHIENTMKGDKKNGK